MVGGKKGHTGVKTKTADPASAGLRLHLAACLLIIFCVAPAYSNTLQNPFVFDDQVNITDNPYIRMTRLTWDQIERAALQDRFQLRLLSNTTFALDYYFHGLDPARMHALNIALHAASSVLVYLVVFFMIPLATVMRFSEKRRVQASLAAALLWALNPAHTQAVSYLVQRQTELAVFFMLVCFLFHLRGRAAPFGQGLVLHSISFLALAAAALSKEIGLTMPAVLILFELIFMARPDEEEGERRATIIGLAVVFFICAGVALAALLMSGILSSYLGRYQDFSYGPGQRLLTESRVVVSYLATIVLPAPSRLCLDHQVTVSAGLLHPWTTLPAALVVAGSLVFALFAARRHPAASFAAVGFLIALAPESTIIPVELMNDHRMYLASLFIIPPLAAAAVLLLAPSRVVPLLAAVVILLGSLTFMRSRVWASPVSLWADSIEKSPELPRPWSNYCGALIEEMEFDKALSACDRAAALDPSEVMAAVNQGIALAMLSRFEEAGVVFRGAIAIHPESAEAHYNYGAHLELRGDAEGAIVEYTRALAINDFYVEARLRRAMLFRKSGGTEEALNELDLLTRLYPSLLPAWIELGRAALDAGDLPRARSALSAAERLGAGQPGVAALAEAVRFYPRGGP